MNFIGSRRLLEIQNEPRSLIRGARRCLFFPWVPVERAEGEHLFIATASDLSMWEPKDVELLQTIPALVRLQRPGSMTQADMLTLKGAKVVYVDVWCGDAAVRQQLLDVMLPHMETINNFVV
jgi:hypothetical protein